MMKACQKTGPFIRDNGFTLLEVLIAITIFSFGLLAIAGMQVAAMKGNTHAKGVTEGVTVVVDQMEKLMALPYDNVTSGGPTTIDGIYTLQWAVQTDTPEPNTKTISITATWTDTGVGKSAQIQQVIANVY
jgi:type IV pilus assembly protein PilV